MLQNRRKHFSTFHWQCTLVAHSADVVWRMARIRIWIKAEDDLWLGMFNNLFQVWYKDRCQVLQLRGPRSAPEPSACYAAKRQVSVGDGKARTLMQLSYQNVKLDPGIHDRINP